MFRGKWICLGRKQIDSMFKERVCGNKLSLYSTIHKNKLHLFRKKAQIDLKKSEITALTMKERVKLYAALYVSCQSRQANLTDFFRHENHDFPPSLSDYGTIQTLPNKADFL